MRKFTLLVALFAAMTLSAQEPEWVAQIEIEGQQITSLNCQNLHELINAGKTDTKQEMAVTYDREKSVLLFRNADIKWHDVKNLPFLKVEENLTIVAEGSNSVEMKDAKYFIVAKADVTIQAEEAGENKLMAYGISWGQVAEKAPYSGTYVYLDGEADLTVKNITAAAHYFEYGIVGSQEGANKVNFVGASFYMDISKEATMEISEMNLSGCEIKSPAGAAFSAELKGIAKDGKLVAGESIMIRLKTEGIDNILESSNPEIKKFVNGQLYIFRNGEIFNAQGARVE